MTTTEPDEHETSAPTSTRQLLVDVAARAFVEDGYTNVSVRQLAKQSNMTSGAIYGNFDNKGDLLMEVIDARIRQQLEVAPRPGTEHLPDVLADIFGDYPDRAEMRALFVEGAAAGRSDPEVRRRLSEGQGASLRTWARAYLDMQQRGELDDDLDPGEVVKVLWAIELGIGILEAMAIELPDPRQVAEIVRRMATGLNATHDTGA